MAIFHELRHFACHEFVDLGDTCIEDFLGDGLYVKVERRIFCGGECLVWIPCSLGGDAGSRFAMDLLLRLTFGEHVSVALVVDLNVVRELGLVCFALLALRFRDICSVVVAGWCGFGCELCSNLGSSSSSSRSRSRGRYRGRRRGRRRLRLRVGAIPSARHCVRVSMHDSMQRDDGGWQVRMQTKLPGWTLMTRSDPVQLVQALQTKASSSSSSCFTLGRSQFPAPKSEKRA